MLKSLSWSQFLILGWVVLISLSYVGKVEGYVYPVITNFTIERTVSSGIGTIFWGSFDKVRNCSFNDHYVEYKEDDIYIKVHIQVLETAKIHKTGHQLYGPWYISVTKDKLSELSFYAEHECVPFWKTITPMKSTIINEH